MFVGYALESPFLIRSKDCQKEKKGQQFHAEIKVMTPIKKTMKVRHLLLGSLCFRKYMACAGCNICRDEIRRIFFS